MKNVFFNTFLLIISLRIIPQEEFKGTKTEYRKYFFSSLRKAIKEELFYKPILGIPFSLTIIYLFSFKYNNLMNNFWISGPITVLIIISIMYLLSFLILYAILFQRNNSFFKVRVSHK